MIIEGIECEDKSVAATGISPGELYMAKRNTGWHLLTCKYVSEHGWVANQEGKYPYDLWECFKVKENS